MPHTKEVKSKLKLNALGHSYNDIYFFIIPLLLPLLREEFSINYVQSGLILTIHVALRSLFSLLFGYFGDQYDKRVIIASGFVFSSVFLGSLIWIKNFPTIVALLFLLAIGVSTYHPLATAMVRENSSIKDRGRYLSLFSAAGTAGIIVASFLFSIFVQRWGWKITCLLFSFPGYFLAYAYLKLKKDRKNHQAEAERKIKKSFIYLFFTSVGIRCLGHWAILSFLPIYATDYMGMKPENSAWIIGVNFAGVFLGSLMSSKISYKRQPIFFMLSTTLISSCLLLGITFITHAQILALLIVIIGFSEGMFFPAQNTWLTFVCPIHKQGKYFGIGLFAEGLSATLAPALYGWIADQIGLVWAYRLAVIPSFISFALFLILHFLENKQSMMEDSSILY
jgi:MFS family permease